MYSISADELHDAIIDDLKAFCCHMNIDAKENLESHRCRPIEQTIRSVIVKAMLKSTMSMYREELIKETLID